MQRLMLSKIHPSWGTVVVLILSQTGLVRGFLQSTNTALFSSQGQLLLLNDRLCGFSRRSFRLHSHEGEIAGSTLAFATTHIGMSAIRRGLIDRIGTAAQNNGLVGTGLKLPDAWPGDEAGQEIFPTVEIAGRQLYRIIYTIVSFGLLGAGFTAYLKSLAEGGVVSPSEDQMGLLYAVASLCSGMSIASLINPSPLSLVPVYERSKTENGIGSAIQRNDAKKLHAYGLTRITRHPLILPVAPWGLATAMIMGGDLREFFFFGILSVYAVAGCLAQDLRVIREEGSVGTVFNPQESMQDFFRDTSFLPFQALVESRQSIDDVLKEVRWWSIVAGTAIGYEFQHVFVSFLTGYSSQT
eukprot:scaffold7987_cov200-Cylindrotheca_fusiformis.AAC.16